MNESQEVSSFLVDGRKAIYYKIVKYFKKTEKTIAILVINRTRSTALELSELLGSSTRFTRNVSIQPISCQKRKIIRGLKFLSVAINGINLIK